MKWVLQHFLSPLFAAVLAIAGNYYFIEKPLLEKEYTKLGIDIMLSKAAPPHMQNFAQELLKMNSPIDVADTEEKNKLEELMHNIPADFSISDGVTYGEMLVRFAVLLDWASDVNAICPDCINKAMFEERYKDKLREFNDLKAN